MMKLLTDKQLLAYVTQQKPIINGIEQPIDWYSEKSPIQATSIDLHIGDIFIPDCKKEDYGSELNPKSQHILRAGHTAVVSTLEELCLPNNLAAIGFPPSRVSFQGILMTNPGHIDPGYSGRLRFTIINMGSQDYVLEKHKPIVTLLIFELSDTVQKDWFQRHGSSAQPPTQEAIDRLSADFLDINRRATEITNNMLTKAPLYSAFATLVVGAIVSFFSYFFTPGWREPLSDLRKDMELMKANKSLVDFEKDVKNLNGRVGKLEQYQNLPNLTPSTSRTTTEKKQP
ncbi:MAG: hypothetical protein V7K69_29435 [Nostoc sp.]|uniref:dCTP deaminase n=1 Tax=Nostoc sp. TaxID=1180 RepID=UPI002FF97D20